nr:hypothetical protein [Nocardioides sp. LS1]
MARSIATRSGPSSARAWLPSHAYADQPNQISAISTMPSTRPRTSRWLKMAPLTAVIA